MPLETAISQSGSGSFQAIPLAPTPAKDVPPDKFDILDLFAPLGQTLPQSDSDQQAAQANAQPAGDFYSANPPSAPSPTPTPAQETANSSDDDSSMAELEDEKDDTVKSINDALRGLFR